MNITIVSEMVLLKFWMIVAKRANAATAACLSLKIEFLVVLDRLLINVTARRKEYGSLLSQIVLCTFALYVGTLLRALHIIFR